MTGRAKKPAAPKKKANGYKMPAPIPNGEIINDTICKKKWRIGPSIGVGGFGEIYSACEDGSPTKSGSSYPFVVKIEPHENGPLFVEKHFYVRNANQDDINKYMKAKKLSSLGMPTYFGNGSHVYKGDKYRYLVLERYGKDLWTLFKDSGRRFLPVTVFQIGLQMLDVLEYIHSRGYVHADIKGANILLGLKKGTENQAYLVDFGLATRVNDKDFKPDPKCAHNGTIEYTSRDAHVGVPTMRGDLEILGYNMLQWLVGELPWEKSLNQPKTVQELKEKFMKNVRSEVTKYKDVPDSLVKYFEYINTLQPKDVPNYDKCRQLFQTYLKTEGKSRNSKLEFVSVKSKVTKKNGDDESHVEKISAKHKSPNQKGDVQVKRSRKPKVKKVDENEEPENSKTEPKVMKKNAKSKSTEQESDNSLENSKVIKRIGKRKSTEPTVVVKVKKTKLAPKATPPIKKNHANIATQTSEERPRRSPRQVSFDSPISEIIGEKKKKSVNSSGDIFDDSFVIEKVKVKSRKKLLSDEEYTVEKVVKKKVTTVKPKGKSWKDSATIVNGRSPPN